MKIASIMRTVGYCKLNWNFKLTCTQTDSYVYCAPFIKIKINLFSHLADERSPTFHAFTATRSKGTSACCADIL